MDAPGPGKTASEPLTAPGDLDEDGISNWDEYNNAGGDPERFFEIAVDPKQAGLPLLGGAALAILLALGVLAGIRMLGARRSELR